MRVRGRQGGRRLTAAGAAEPEGPDPPSLHAGLVPQSAGGASPEQEQSDQQLALRKRQRIHHSRASPSNSSEEHHSDSRLLYRSRQ